MTCVLSLGPVCFTTWPRVFWTVVIIGVWLGTVLYVISIREGKR